MPELVADKDYFADADGKLTDEANAAVVVARKGTAVSAQTVERYKLKAQEVDVYDAVADHEAKHGNETDAQAADARQRMMAGQPDPDGPVAEGERDEKAKPAAENKAVTRAPANKGA